MTPARTRETVLDGSSEPKTGGTGTRKTKTKKETQRGCAVGPIDAGGGGGGGVAEQRRKW